MPDRLRRKFVDIFAFPAFLKWPEDAEEQARLLTVLESLRGTDALRHKIHDLKIIAELEKNEQFKQRINALLKSVGKEVKDGTSLR